MSRSSSVTAKCSSGASSSGSSSVSAPNWSWSPPASESRLRVDRREQVAERRHEPERARHGVREVGEVIVVAVIAGAEHAGEHEIETAALGGERDEVQAAFRDPEVGSTAPVDLELLAVLFDHDPRDVRG